MYLQYNNTDLGFQVNQFGLEIHVVQEVLWCEWVVLLSGLLTNMILDIDITDFLLLIFSDLL